MDGRSYLSNAKKPCLPHGLSCVVTQVLIIISRDDGRELLQRILKVLTEEDRWFFNDEDRTRHKSFALSWTRLSDSLLGLGLQTHDGFRDSFGFLWKTASLFWLFPLGRRVGQTHPLRSLTLLLLL